MRGAVAVELAFMLILVLVPLLLAIADLGRMLYQYNALTKSVRDGARIVSLCSPAFAEYTIAKDQATNLVVYGSKDGSGNPLVPGLEEVDVDFDPDVGEAPVTVGTVNVVTVKVTGFSLGYITSLPEILDIPALQAFSDISITMRQSETCSTGFI